MRRLLLLLVLFALAVPLAGAGCEPTGTTYYVSTEVGASDSNSGDSTHPWRTIAASLPKLSSNQRLVVRAGTYNELVNVTVSAGTQDDPIWVEAASGAEPKIVGRLWVQGANNWKFDNIDVTWPSSGLTSSDQMVRMRNSHDWRYTNSDISNAHSTAAFGVGSGQYNFLIDHNIIRDTASVNGTNQDHLIYAENDCDANPAGVIERNLLLNSPNGRAVKVGRGSGTTSPAAGCLIIRYNTMVNNTGPSNVQLSYGATDTEIYRNIMVTSDSGYKNVTRFTGIQSGNTAHDNIGYDSAGVVDAGTGLSDTGGNQYLNPSLNAFFVPTNSAATNYGWQAP